MLVIKDLKDYCFFFFFVELMYMTELELILVQRVDSHSHLLPRVNIENYSIETDGRNFYDQPANDPIKQIMKL